MNAKSDRKAPPVAQKTASQYVACEPFYFFMIFRKITAFVIRGNSEVP
jgi:hypothetical protein